MMVLVSHDGSDAAKRNLVEAHREGAEATVAVPQSDDELFFVHLKVVGQRP